MLLDKCLKNEKLKWVFSVNLKPVKQLRRDHICTLNIYHILNKAIIIKDMRLGRVAYFPLCEGVCCGARYHNTLLCFNFNWNFIIQAY